uniref:Putative secreted protein n=1 Tax=Ixodes ricinus TaxID=34613 RepID=A0A090X814_IXORI
MNSFTLALVSSLLLAMLITTASDKISEPNVEGSGGQSTTRVGECSNPDDCDDRKCCKHDTVEVDMVTVSCSPKPEDGTPCSSKTEYVGPSGV